MAVILLVEGDRSLRQAGRDYLTGRGHAVVKAASAAEGLRLLRQLHPELVIFNADVQDMGAEEFHRWLRADPQYAATSVIYLVPTVRRELTGAALQATGERRATVLGKPFRWRELEEEVRASLAAAGQNPPIVGDGTHAQQLVLSRDSYELRGEQGSVLLTPTEFRLIEYLMRRANALVGIEELLEQVWGYHPNTGSPEVVRAHVRNLRRKLSSIMRGGNGIQTVARRGYRLVAESRTSM